MTPQDSYLETFAQRYYAVCRKGPRWYWPFWESDSRLRKRIRSAVAPFGMHGKYLGAVALNCYGLTRGPRRWYWPFRESDRSLRARCISCARKAADG